MYINEMGLFTTCLQKAMALIKGEGLLITVKLVNFLSLRGISVSLWVSAFITYLANLKVDKFLSQILFLSFTSSLL